MTEVDHAHMQVLLWSIVYWIAIVPLAIANGAFRQAVLVPRLGIGVAQPISGILLMGAIAAITWLLVGRLGSQPTARWIAIGAGWFLATVAFEFGMGLVAGRSWSEMLAQYRFVDNNIWPVVLLWVAVAPVAIAQVRSLIVR